MVKIKLSLSWLFAVAIAVVLTVQGTACVAAPRVDVSKNPPEHTPTPAELEQNKKRQEKIDKEMEELNKKRKLEQDQNNQQEKKPGPTTA